MPRIFDKIEQQLLPALQEMVQPATRTDLCMGCFSLRRWRELAPLLEPWPGGPAHTCRLLVGMQRLPGQQQPDVGAG